MWEKAGDKSKLPIIAAKLIVAFLGFIAGSFVPVAFLYLGVFIIRRGISWRALLGTLWRVILIPIVFMLLMAVIVWTLDLTAGETAGFSPEAFDWFITALGLGFLSGIAAFSYGLIQGIRAVRRKKEKPEDLP
jgi:uncharacterized membrane protein YbhN (UPF0104 family)